MVKLNVNKNELIGAFDNKLNTFHHNIYYHNRDNEYCADPFLGFRLKKLKKYIDNKLILETNSLGLREQELSEENKFEVLFLGGSFIYGVNAPGDEATIPRLFSDINKSTVFNAGIPGHVLKQHFSLYFNYLMHLEVKKIILVFGFNDLVNCFNNKSYGEISIDSYQKTIDEINKSPIIKPLKILLRNLFSFKGLKTKNLKRNKTKNIENYEKKILKYCDRVFKDIKLFNNYCKKNNVELFTILQPTLVNSKKKLSSYEKNHLSNLNDEKKKFVIKFYQILSDKLKSFENFSNFSGVYDEFDRMIFTDEVHVGDFGNKVFSEKLSSFVN